MTDVFGTLIALDTSADILGDFAAQTSRWPFLSDRLYDVKRNLDVALVSLKNWQQKYDIQDRRPLIYVHILFGRLGWDVISQTVGDVRADSKTIRSDVDKIVSRALAIKSGYTPRRPSDQSYAPYEKQAVEDALRKIRTKTLWSRKFEYRVLSRLNDLQYRINCLHRDLGVLERRSDYYLEYEHPDVFAKVRRIAGRKVVLRVKDTRGSISRILKDQIAGRRDADMLHHASAGLELKDIHIGLTAPQIPKEDFAFLLSMYGSRTTHELLSHPVKITADRTRFPADFRSVLSDLICYPLKPVHILPPSPHPTAGFKLSFPEPYRTILADLEYKDPLSTHIRQQASQQLLSPEDQTGLAIAISHGCFRLLGSKWLNFLDSKTLRWRRPAPGTYSTKWTTILTAGPGDTSITRTLDEAIATAKSRRFDSTDLSKHTQIFRLGLVLTELLLKTPISYIAFRPPDQVEIYIPELNGGAPCSAWDIAEEIVQRHVGNLVLGQTVFLCLSVFGGKEVGVRIAERDVEAWFYKEVLSQIEVLEGLVKRGTNATGLGGGMGEGSGFATPRSAGGSDAGGGGGAGNGGGSGVGSGSGNGNESGGGGRGRGRMFDY